MLKKIGLMVVVASMAMTANMAWANNSAKEALVKKIYNNQDPSDYEDATFKSLSNQVFYLINKLEAEEGGIVCDAVGYELGLGNSGEPARNLKVTHLKNGLTRASFTQAGSGKTVIDFKISCQGNKCLINDIYHYYNGKRISTKQQYQEALTDLKTKGYCD